MKPQLPTTALLIVLAAALAACDGESRSRTPPTQVNVIHAAQSFGALDFLRVERREQTLNYRQSDVFNFDTDTYTFNVEAVRPRSDPERVHSFTATLTPGNDYIFVLGEDAGQVREIIVELERSPVPAGESEVVLVHAAGGLGPVDVYVEPPGTVLSAANPRGTLDFHGTLPTFTTPEGDYEVSLTEPGNPANVLLASQPFAPPGGAVSVVSILDGANVGLAPLAVLISAGGSDLTVVDRNLQAGIRAINTTTSGGALDVTIDRNFSPPLLPAVPFRVPSAHALFDAGNRSLSVSPAGNPGALELDQGFTAEPGGLGTWLIAGSPGALTATFSPDDGRVVTGQARLTVYNGATLASRVDTYIVLPGTDVNTVLPTASVDFAAIVPDLRFSPGDYDIVVREAATTNVLSGPFPITIGAEGTYGILLTDTVGGGSIDITPIDDFD